MRRENHVPENCLLVVISQEHDEELFVHRQLNAVLTELAPTEALVAETLRDLAATLACETMTAELVSLPAEVGTSEIAIIKAKFKERMNALISRTQEARPDFAKAKQESEFGKVWKDHGWALLINYFSHHISLEKTAEDQMWLGD